MVKRLVVIFTALSAFVVFYSVMGIRSQRSSYHQRLITYHKSIAKDNGSKNSISKVDVDDSTKNPLKKKKRKRGRAIEQIFSFIPNEPVYKEFAIVQAVVFPTPTHYSFHFFFSDKKRGPPAA